jgi:hypothetical protein
LLGTTYETHDIVSVGEIMARGKASDDMTTLQMALVGYELERQKIDEKIREIQAQLGRRSPGRTGAAQQPAAKKRILSPAARKRIAMAQKRRWAEHRRRAAQAAKAGKAEKS